MTRSPAQPGDTTSGFAGLARRIDRIRATVDREAATVAALDADLAACAADLRRAMATAPSPAPDPGTARVAAAATPADTPGRRTSPGDILDDGADLFDDVPV